MEERISEAEVSMILDTYMYTNYEYAKDGQSLKSIVDEMPSKIDVEERYSKEYSILKEAVKLPQIGSLLISCQSQNMGYNEGTNAVTFTSEDMEKVYVIFRGTADGEWLDNGKGMTEVSTIQQREALNYFDEVVEKLELSKEQQVYMSGHSKGANKVQFVTMDSKYSYLIKNTYAIDGQGMSDKSIDNWKEDLGEEEYDKRRSKIYGINGENDFVSVLGNCIIPAGQISFVKTPANMSDIVGFHDITRMFAEYTEDDDGNTLLTYKGRKNEYVSDRGSFAKLIGKISDKVMEMPSYLRKGSAMTLMQLCELMMGKDKKIGLNGEMADITDLISFKDLGMTAILTSLFGSKEGLELFRSVINEQSFEKNAELEKDLFVNYEAMKNSAAQLMETADRINSLLLEMEMQSVVIPLLFDGYSFRKPHIDNSVVKLKLMQNKLKRMGQMQMDIAALYEKFDNLELEY